MLCFHAGVIMGFLYPACYGEEELLNTLLGPLNERFLTMQLPWSTHPTALFPRSLGVKLHTFFLWCFLIKLLGGSVAYAATVRIEGSIPLRKPISEIDLDIVVSSVEPKDQLADYSDIKSYLEVLVKGNTVAFTDADAQNSNNKYLVTYQNSFADPKPNNYTVTIKIKLRKLSGTIDDDLENNSLRVKAKYKKDSESTETLISRSNLVFTAAPSFSPELPIVGSHKQLLVNMKAVSTVSTSTGQEKTPNVVYAYAFKVDDSSPQEFDLPARIFDANSDPKPTTCRLIAPSSNRGECLQKCAGENDGRTNVYLDHTEIANRNFENLYVNRAIITPNADVSLTLGGLENQKKYFVFLVYEQGTKASECLVGEPSINYTLTELNGEKEASVVDLRCFIASATYGSPLAQEVEVFRWYRDHILQQTFAGRMLIKTYYRVSPMLAQWVHENPTIRRWSLLVLDSLGSMIKAQRLKNKDPSPSDQTPRTPSHGHS